MRRAKTLISLGISPGWSESSLCAQWVAKEPRFLHADSEDADQTGRMPRLIWVFVGAHSLCWFRHVAAHIVITLRLVTLFCQYHLTLGRFAGRPHFVVSYVAALALGAGWELRTLIIAVPGDLYIVFGISITNTRSHPRTKCYQLTLFLNILRLS